MTDATKDQWNTHDFKVKMVDWSAVRGSKLAYTCRRCGRMFSHFAIVTAQNGGPWATDGEGRVLDRLVSNRWVAEECPGQFKSKDDEDRKQLSSRSVPELAS
jgi:hypothetical protein